MRTILPTSVAALCACTAIGFTASSALGHGNHHPRGKFVADACVFPTTTANPDADPNPEARHIYWGACTPVQFSQGGMTVTLVLAR